MLRMHLYQQWLIMVCAPQHLTTIDLQGQRDPTFWPPELVSIHQLIQGEHQMVHSAGCGHPCHHEVGATQQVGLHGALSRLGSVAVGRQAVVQGDSLRLGTVRLPLRGCQGDQSGPKEYGSDMTDQVDLLTDAEVSQGCDKCGKWNTRCCHQPHTAGCPGPGKRN